MTLEITGLDELVKQLASIHDGLPQMVGNAMEDVIDPPMDEAAEQTPHRTGNLRRSKFVNAPTVNGSAVSIDFGFSAGYALPVHNIPPPPMKSVGGRSATHLNGKWRFMADPIEKAAPGFADGLVKSIDKQLQEMLG